MRGSSLLFLFVLLAYCVGCGGSGTGTGFVVSGKVTYPDGVPLRTGEVTFVSGSFTGNAYILMDGTYSTSVRIPTGRTYKVSVQPGEYMDTNPYAPPVTTQLIHPKYHDPATSGLVVEVREATIFNIVVEVP